MKRLSCASGGKSLLNFLACGDAGSKERLQTYGKHKEVIDLCAASVHLVARNFFATAMF